MRATPFNLQGKGVSLETLSSAGKWKKEGSFCGGVGEPTSVLDTRRSPSPPTSTSTLSSSLGGGSGSSDSAGVAAVSDNPPHKWLPSQDGSSGAAAAAAATSDGGASASSSSRKDEWASELQQIPASLEIGGAGGSEKCGAGAGGGLGMEYWENMLSESASPGNEQSIFRWFGDMDDPSLKQLLQSGAGGSGGGMAAEFEAGTGDGGFGVVDPGFPFGAGIPSSMSVNANATNPPGTAAVGGDFPLSSSSSNRLLPVQNPALPNFRGTAGFGSGNPSNPIFSPPPNSLPLPLPLSLPPTLFYQQQPPLETIDEKPQLFSSQQQSHPPPNPSFFLPLPYSQQEQPQQQHVLPLQSKRHHPLDPSIPKMTFPDSGQELFIRRPQQPLPTQQQQAFSSLHQQQQLLPHQLQQRPMKPKLDDPNHHQQQAVIDQLFKAAELAETGNTVHARGILARLNHQLSSLGKPLQRAAFYFKEALQLLLTTTAATTSPPSPRPLPSPFDIVFKISAYKAFSEVSPFLQFIHFTSNQALLEALDGFARIHIFDFDIGLGGQWASFMQELALKPAGAAPSLKITAFTSPISSHDPLELGLTRENLSHFARDLNIPFEFNLVSLDSFDPSSPLLALSDSDSVAVNLPVGSNTPPLPFLLRVVKQLAPKIVVSVDRGSDRSDLSFSHHFLHALQSFSLLLDSLDAVNVNPDALQKIERFLLLPRIESLVLGRHRAGEKMPPWRSLFASAGFSPLPFSNFSETLAECLVKRLQVRGFQVEKRQGSLYLCWQRGDLVSVSAWRC